MPPRYAYWTILIDRQPTAFRARDREELLPTLAQLRRTNADVVMLWFARGRLWESPAAEQEAQRRRPVDEKRGREWRPGGAHRDPRDRFRKKDGAAPARRDRPGRPPRGAAPFSRRGARPKKKPDREE